MKKHLLNTLALIIAVVITAFTAPGKTGYVYFTYIGLSTSDPNEVKDLINWLEDWQGENEECIGANQACQIAIEERSLSGYPSSRNLFYAAPSLVLDAQDIGYNDGLYKPVYVSGPPIIICNKP